MPDNLSPPVGMVAMTILDPVEAERAVVRVLLPPMGFEACPETEAAKANLTGHHIRYGTSEPARATGCVELSDGGEDA